LFPIATRWTPSHPAFSGMTELCLTKKITDQIREFDKTGILGYFEDPALS